MFLYCYIQENELIVYVDRKSGKKYHGIKDPKSDWTSFPEWEKEKLIAVYTDFATGWRYYGIVDPVSGWIDYSGYTKPREEQSVDAIVAKVSSLLNITDILAGNVFNTRQLVLRIKNT